MTKIIAVDLDETLSETLDATLAYHDYKIENIPITRSQITNFVLREIPHYKALGITQQEGTKYFNEVIDKKEIAFETVSGAKEKLSERKNAWYKLKILTGRPERQREITTQRVEKYFPNLFDEIIFANYFTGKDKSKWEICQEKWIAYMIEDNYDYAANTAQYWIKTYLLAKPRNQEYHNTNPQIIKVDGRKDILL